MNFNLRGEAKFTGVVPTGPGDEIYARSAAPRTFNCLHRATGPPFCSASITSYLALHVQ
jgi:hypothetical protein